MERQKLHVLVVVAHPHDFMHCSGTCGIHTSIGDTVTIVSVTSGASTPHNEKLSTELAKPPQEQDPDIVNMTPKQFASVKTEELRNVAALFGVADVRVLEFPDHPFYLRDNLQAIDQLKDIIIEVRPHVLITQSPFTSRPNSGPHGLASGVHNDHNETAYAALQARSQARAPRFGSTQRPHKIAAVYFLGIYFEPSQIHFNVDISDWYEQKVQAEAMYISQGHTLARARRSIELTSGHTGRYNGTKYAESFVREQQELLPHITVLPSTLKRAESPIV